TGELMVALEGELIVARVRGEFTLELLRDCHEQVLSLAHSTGRTRVLYDVRVRVPPSVDIALAQRELGENLQALTLRRAIVVPSSRLAYLTRLAFGEADCRVFYNDLEQAMRWLEEGGPA